MKGKLFTGLLCASCVWPATVLSDVLHQKTADAKKAYATAQELLAEADLHLKDAKEQLATYRKGFGAPITVAKAPAPRTPWCDRSCAAAYAKHFKSDGAIDEKAPPPVDKVANLKKRVDDALKDASPPADAAALVKKLGDSASLDAEDKAVLVIACQPNLSAKDCQDGLTNLADPKNFKNFPKIPEMWCDEDCLTAHATLLTDKSELDFSKLPDPKIRDEVRTAIAAADPKNFLGLSTKLAFNDHEAEAKALVLALCLDEKGEFSKKCVERSDSIAKFDATKDQELQKIVEAAQKTANAAKANSEFLRAALSAAEKDQNLASDEPVARISDRLERVRRARCATAYCWGGHDGRRSAIEPILDLPVGMYWATSGSSLANYINANNIKIQFNAGLRYWFAYDAMSIGILLAQPDLTETQSTIDFRNKSLPKSQVRRPYPTLVLGFVGDILQLSLSYDELRNAPSNSENHLPEYPSNGVLARALTFGVAISPLTAARNGIGASIGAKEESK